MQSIDYDGVYSFLSSQCTTSFCMPIRLCSVFPVWLKKSIVFGISLLGFLSVQCSHIIIDTPFFRRLHTPRTNVRKWILYCGILHLLDINNYVNRYEHFFTSSFAFHVFIIFNKFSCVRMRDGDFFYNIFADFVRCSF